MSTPEFDKPDMKTDDLTALNVERIGKLFPQVIVEKQGEDGEIEKGIDFDALRTILSGEIVEDERERYRLDWPGKKASLVKANTPITDTLRPDRAESVDWEHTENVFIEGDNFKALKILQESYLGQVKMIYIDPPYNTGKDFVYSDKFTMDKGEYEEAIGQHDEEDNKLFKENTKTNPRYHSDWLSMMYERLYIARDLLRDDGVIFISIDDNEVHNLRKICDEIFGEENFVASVIWERAYAPVNLKRHFSESHDYIVCYSKNIEMLGNLGLARSDDAQARYKNVDDDPRGVWKSSDLSVGPAVQDNIYPIKTPSGREVFPPSGYSWRFSEKKLQKLIEDNRIWFGKDGNSVPSYKRFLSEVKNTITPMTVWKYQEVGHSQDATKELKLLFDGSAFFDYPKSVRLIKRLIELGSSENDIVLDFFAGSATTAHAVMAQNAEDGGNRKYIMVQLDEETDEKSEAYKAGYQTIAELARERIRRAAKKIQTELKEKHGDTDPPEARQRVAATPDFGFRAYRVDSTNMKDVYYHPKDLKQGELLDLVDHVKADRSPEDLLTQLILDLGLTLDLPMESIERGEQTIYTVGGNSLVACLDTKITMDIVDEIAGMQPLRAVFRDSAFASEDDRINLDTHFKRHSPDTKITVI